MLGSEEGQGLINSKATPFDLALLGRCMQGFLWFQAKLLACLTAIAGSDPSLALCMCVEQQLQRGNDCISCISDLLSCSKNGPSHRFWHYQTRHSAWPPMSAGSVDRPASQGHQLLGPHWRTPSRPPGPRPIPIPSSRSTTTYAQLHHPPADHSSMELAYQPKLLHELI